MRSTPASMPRMAVPMSVTVTMQSVCITPPGVDKPVGLQPLADSINELASQTKEAASDMQHRLEKQAQKANTAAAHYIQHAPFKSVLIAAGVGATAAALMSWWIGSRPR